MVTLVAGIVPIGAVVALGGGRLGVVARILRYTPSRGYVANLKTGRMHPTSIQRLVQGHFKPLVRVLFIPPEGFVHRLSVQSSILTQTKHLRVFVARHLALDERFTHATYGEFWKIEAIERLKKEFLKMKNDQYNATDGDGRRKPKVRLPPYCTACGKVFSPTTKAAHRCLDCIIANRSPGKSCHCRSCGTQFERKHGSYEIRCPLHHKKKKAAA